MFLQRISRKCRLIGLYKSVLSKMMTTHKIQFVAEGESLSTCRRFEEIGKSKKKKRIDKERQTRSRKCISHYDIGFCLGS